MLQNLKNLIGFDVRSMDGDSGDRVAGEIDDFYFDEGQWMIRYFIVSTGNWLKGRSLLLSPSAFEKPDWRSHRMEVNLTKDLMRSSPKLDLAGPLTREQEKELHRHYGWPVYWRAFGLSDASESLARASMLPHGQAEKEVVVKKREGGGKRLHSTKNVLGYHVQALDGEMGHIEGFLVEDQGWILRYAVVDLRNWLPGRRVIIAPQWIKDFLWEESKAVVNLKKIRIEESPEYDPAIPIGRAYEEELYGHYGQEKYWGSEWEPPVRGAA